MAVLDIRGAIIGQTSMAIKAPCMIATTGANIALAGVQTIDGITVGNNNERVLVKDQSDPTQNGIYQAAIGNWTLTTDFAGSPPSVAFGTLVLVTSGGLNQGILFEQTCRDNPIIIGTSRIAFAPLPNATSQATTSSTAATIGIGTQTFTIPPGLAFSVNQWVLIQETSNSANKMLGQITTYVGTSLAVNVIAVAGSGSHTDWTIVLTNSPAAAGYQPPVGTGNVTGPGSATSGHIAIFSGASGNLLADGGALGGLAALSEIAAQQLNANAIAIGGAMLNGTIIPSATNNALTLSIVTLQGNTPSSSDPVFFAFQPNPTTGIYAITTLQSALSITIPSGSTLGFSNSTPGRFWLIAINSAGAISLAVINCLSGTNTFPLQAQGICNVSAFGPGANSAQVFYAVSSLPNVPYCVLGSVGYEAGNTLATAGAWSAMPSVVTLYRSGVPLPSQVVQSQFDRYGAAGTTTNFWAAGNTAPTTSNGSQVTSLAVAPSSSVNLLRVRAQVYVNETGTGNAGVVGYLIQDSNATALAAGTAEAGTSNALAAIPLQYTALAATLASTTFKLYVGAIGGGTASWNGTSGGSALLGGLANTFIEIEEIAA